MSIGFEIYIERGTLDVYAQGCHMRCIEEMIFLLVKIVLRC